MFVSRNRRKETAKKVAIGSTIAAAAGYLAGILTAPKSGKQTRQEIKKAADKGVANAESELKNLHVDLEKAAKDAKKASAKAGAKAQQELKVLVDKAKASKDKAGAVVSAVRRGEASDEDLAKAVKQAHHALANLKTYLKK